MLTINVSQAKAKFLELIRRTQDRESVIVEKNGAPVAAILPYSDYVGLERLRAYLTMQEIFQAAKDSEITAREIYQESRRQLEGR